MNKEVCAECLGLSAVFVCAECGVNLCAECVQVHYNEHEVEKHKPTDLEQGLGQETCL